ncbi:hypothetical protein D8L93_04185 [Sodalis-like symbiont of Bactericera trigonica]|nr:hypothetical protein D8L93_04185 [Sodalis-like symbiont of Bactericera trigonica]
MRKVMRTNDQFGRAEPDSHALKPQARTLLLPRLETELVITQGFIGSETNGAKILHPAATLLPAACWCIIIPTIRRCSAL